MDYSAVVSAIMGGVHAHPLAYEMSRFLLTLSQLPSGVLIVLDGLGFEGFSCKNSREEPVFYWLPQYANPVANMFITKPLRRALGMPERAKRTEFDNFEGRILKIPGPAGNNCSGKGIDENDRSGSAGGKDGEADRQVPPTVAVVSPSENSLSEALLSGTANSASCTRQQHLKVPGNDQNEGLGDNQQWGRAISAASACSVYTLIESPDVDNFARSAAKLNQKHGLNLRPVQIKLFLGSCKCLASLAFWTDRLFHMDVLATVCLLIMMLGITWSHFLDYDEIGLPTFSVLCCVMKLWAW
eukprot:TRINITY_DN122084_c0_g1_i1.p1 TRINITY_DN122084_c0_g1~~TRINITY_DN122084_c0_g1_i1.p1  ORF type:complete len:317 (-),score=45.58 TRINITY_DN122084_c0_g1_i1:230-1126(-)